MRPISPRMWVAAVMLSPWVCPAQAQTQSPRAAAPLDLTGYWVSIVTEDWRYRMVTPKKSDYPSIPLNAEGKKAADSWDPAKDQASGEQCRAFGAANIMRQPGRIHITWENDNTLKLETDAGTQTRLFTFGAPSGGAGTWQGESRAQWDFAGGRPGRGKGGALKVVTTKARAGYLQSNGVPYSANATVTEYFHRTDEENGDAWLIVTTLVEDPQYLTGPFQRSSHFRRQADGAGWNPTSCAVQ